MHDTTASEGGHRFNVKKVINRVRKGTDYDTSTSAINWVCRVRTWEKIIDMVNETCAPPVQKRTRKAVECLTVKVNDSKLLLPADGTRHAFSPLRTGLDGILCNDARLSYHELVTLVSSFTGWDVDFVKDDVQVRLYCSALVLHPGGESRTYWSTENRYAYNRGARRDMIEVDLGQGRTGAAQITSFIKMDGGIDRQSEGVIVRWLSKSSLSTSNDHRDRPLCNYPLSRNHCLWEWSDAGRNRDCFQDRGFRNRVNTHKLWSHVSRRNRENVIRSERRARYDILRYDSITGHANIHKDPSTGHMLQTLQIV